jgi:hypothetical protein
MRSTVRRDPGRWGEGFQGARVLEADTTPQHPQAPHRRPGALEDWATADKPTWGRTRVDFDRAPADISNDAAEAVRQLNLRTRAEGDDWQHPGDAYSTVANLAYLAGGLPQALTQIRALVERLHGNGNLTSDKNDLVSDLHTVFSGLEDARAAAETLYTALNRVHAGLGPIGYAE